MMKKDQNDFSFDEKQAKNLMRKAKFWSTVKSIGITVIVTPIVLLILWYGFRMLSLDNAQKSMDETMLFNEISGPNVHISHQSYHTNWFGGAIQSRTYKMLGDRPYIWEPIEGQYNLFGTLLRNVSIYNSIQLDRSESLAESNQFERYNTYTGDREMLFYHPSITYDVYKDTLHELDQLEEGTLVELGISFDQAYSFDEIKSKLPSDIREKVVWWWVDTFTDERLDFMKQGQDTVGANSLFIYGFHSEHTKPMQFDEGYDGMNSFIRSIETLRGGKNFGWEADQVYQSLVGEDGKLEKSDLKMIGAVVTGTSEQLQSLQGQTYIKASTFGVISNKK